MIRIKNYIFNENEIVKIQFDDGSEEMEIDHKNGNRTFIDGTFEDIEWNYGKDENNKLKENNKELVETNMKLAIKNKELYDENKKLKEEITKREEVMLDKEKEIAILEEENKKLKFSMQDTYDSANDTCGELQQRIDKAIEYIETTETYDDVIGYYLIKDSDIKEELQELLKILRGEEND